MTQLYVKPKVEFANGEEIVFKDFFITNYPVFCSYASTMVADASVCEDVVQETFIRLWESKKVFHSELSLKSYFYKAIRNRCLDIIKHNKVKEKFLEHQPEIDVVKPYVLDEIVKREAYSIIYKEVNKLPEMGKKVLLLVLEGKDNKEVAGELGINISTVKTHKARAFKVLRKKHALELLLFLISKKRSLSAI